MARAARAEAMEKEAEAAAASAHVSRARQEAQRQTDRRLMLAAKAKRREEDVSWVARRVKAMVRVYLVWSRLLTWRPPHLLFPSCLQIALTLSVVGR